MHWLSLLQGSGTLYFLQNLNMAVGSGGKSAQPSKGYLFLAEISFMMELCPLSRGCRAKDSRVLVPVVLVREVPVVTLLPNLRKVPLNLCLSMGNLGIL